MPDHLAGARERFVRMLARKLTPFYLPPKTPDDVKLYPNAAHGLVHITGMLALEPRLQGVQGIDGPLYFDPYEFQTAVWFHNADRSLALERALGVKGEGEICAALLKGSPFDLRARERITDAMRQHAKKDDEPGDSPLLTALRIADKVDRFSATGIWSSASHLWYLEPYDRKNPFAYGSTSERGLTSQYGGLFRGLEWVRMLPSDEARKLIDPMGIRLFIEFIRYLGEEMARHLGVPNRAEDNIREALGPYYERYATCDPVKRPYET
ncbi:hypothetical protein A2110_02850 [Candidatus Jorgensenbacteria bacterium GWA1_54_12]|uniref:Uncharacterized protein n=1 Tax=Candidatus Jorgensenbacteria bacterium GWA1_54_12 TaxID=1798468 RepID=A0A1F6BKP7_9BACT|nr:MAG: hypothetical protein A2110_02850 [Candidatus Jorgensenbacteria bacterium GWA1_54_12]